MLQKSTDKSNLHPKTNLYQFETIVGLKLFSIMHILFPNFSKLVIKLGYIVDRGVK